MTRRHRQDVAERGAGATTSPALARRRPTGISYQVPVRPTYAPWRSSRSVTPAIGPRQRDMVSGGLRPSGRPPRIGYGVQHRIPGEVGGDLGQGEVVERRLVDRFGREREQDVAVAGGVE